MRPVLAQALVPWVLVLGSSTPAQRALGERCDSITTFATGLRPWRELHVATWGNDVTGNGSPDRPFATIGVAARQATPGTAVRVAPGTYAGGQFVYDLHGVADAPIWVGGTEAGRVVINGGSEGLHLVRPRYVIPRQVDVAEETFCPAFSRGSSGAISAAANECESCSTACPAFFHAGRKTRRCFRSTGTNASAPARRCTRGGAWVVNWWRRRESSG